MAKQTFTTGSVLTATQMNNLQANDYNWELNGQTASYVLVAADAGKRVQMNAAGSTTITVNTGLFTAGDSVIIQNIGAGTCTVTAGTATVNKATNASLALAQYQAGTLYFVSASSAIFFPFDVGASTSFTGVSVKRTTAQTIPNTTNTDLLWTSENYDTDNFHDNTTNSQRLTVPSGKDGKYQINAMLVCSDWTGYATNVYIYKNTTAITRATIYSSGQQPCFTLTSCLDLVAGDYVKLVMYTGYTGGSTFEFLGSWNEFSMYKVG